MNLKTYLIAGAVVIFLGLISASKILYNHNQVLKADNSRLSNNNSQLMAENKQNTDLLLTKDEFISSMSTRLKRVLDSLQIKPKQVLKIEEKQVLIHDTIPKLVPTYPLSDKFWKILDQEKCWSWEGMAKLENDSLVINRIGFDYHNKTTDIFSKKLKFKFLFIKIYSKKEFVQNSISECGESTSRTITIK